MKQNSNKEEEPRGKGIRMQRGKRKKMGNRASVGCALLLFGVLLIVAGALIYTYQSEQWNRQASAEGKAEQEILNWQGEAALAAGEAAAVTAYSEQPDSDSGLLTEEMGVTGASCLIQEDGAHFTLTGEAAELPESEDNLFYLFALETYEDEIGDAQDFIASTKMADEFTLSAEVNEFQEDSRLTDKFVVAVKNDGKYQAVSAPAYITNPEVLADYTEPFPEAESIKGLLVDSQKLGTTELEELGVKHAVYNIPVGRLLGESTQKDYPTITYVYNGKEYKLNGHVVSEYDYVFSTLTKKGIVTTAILLNNKSTAYPQMIHPLSRDGNAYYYAFNAAEEEGSEYLEAIVAFLAERYRDETHGTVMNWIVGNEINVRSLWNYMQYVDLKTYVKEYVRAFRICYNTIKSMNANARVYISLDQQWKKELTSESSYNSRDVLDEFNAQIAREGNIGWGLAHHPYSVPMTWPKFWELSEQNQELVRESEDTAMVTIYNIDVVTDYMQQEEFLTPEGEVRPILLSEMGFTSTYGEDVQAAAFAYAYLIAENNPYIDAMILSRETDAAEEVAQGLALGLSYQNGRKKYIYDVFKYIDTDQAEEYTEFAKNYIGIVDWSEVIEGY